MVRVVSYYYNNLFAFKQRLIASKFISQDISFDLVGCPTHGVFDYANFNENFPKVSLGLRTTVDGMKHWGLRSYFTIKVQRTLMRELKLE